LYEEAVPGLHHRLIFDKAYSMSALLTIVHILVISLVLFFFWKKQIGVVRKIFWPGAVLKLLSGVLVGVLYFYYYGVGDTLIYWRDGDTLARFAMDHPSEYLRFLWSDYENSFRVAQELNLQDSRAIFFVKFVSILSILTGSNYWVISIYFSTISFLGILYFLRTVERYLPEQIIPAAIAFLFFPSVVFWSSGLIKESVAFASLIFLTGLFLRAWFSNSVGVIESTIGVMAIWLLWRLKYYYGAVFFPVLVTCLAYKFMFYYVIKPRKFTAEILIWCLLLLVPSILITFTNYNFHVTRFLDVLVENNNAYRTLSSAEDLIHYNNLQPTTLSLLKNAPMALVSGLFRPFIFEATTTFQIFASIENFFLLVFTIGAVWRIRELYSSSQRMLVVASIVYVVFLCIFLALSSPNFGTLSRYRIGFLPFFVWLILTNNPLFAGCQQLLKRLVQ
jgi:hypothetical protein